MSSVIEPSRLDAAPHVVDFYEDDVQLVESVGHYLLDAAATGAVGIVIAADPHRDALVAHLGDAGLDVAAAADDGTLAWWDAPTMLRRCARGDGIDRAAFLEVVGAPVRDAAAGGRPVRVFGELVALLWESGAVMAAIQLEALWNELAAEVPFWLYCAYPRRAVSGDEHADALRHVCGLHTAVVDPVPVRRAWRFPAEFAAPAGARRAVTDALRRAGHDGDVVDDAQLIVTELAANAVVHARSPFWVRVRMERGSLRIEVVDGSPVLPQVREHSVTNGSGRGLRLVAALASRWGTEPATDGKAIWVELALGGRACI